MTIDKAKLRALAEAAIRSGEESGQRWPQEDDWFAPDDDGEELEFVKGASPATVLALLDEVERLESQAVSRCSLHKRECGAMWEVQGELIDERDRLKDENESLRKDAERYRWLRGSTYSGAVLRAMATGDLVGAYCDERVDVAMPKDEP